MACLTREKDKYYRIQWEFTVSAGPETGRMIDGSLYLGRCRRVEAKARLREIEQWEEAVKSGRHLGNGRWQEVCERWLRERELALTPQAGAPGHTESGVEQLIESPFFRSRCSA